VNETICKGNISTAESLIPFGSVCVSPGEKDRAILNIKRIDGIIRRRTEYFLLILTRMNL